MTNLCKVQVSIKLEYEFTGEKLLCGQINFQANFHDGYDPR